MSANLAKHVGQRIPLIKFTHGFNKRNKNFFKHI